MQSTMPTALSTPLAGGARAVQRPALQGGVGGLVSAFPGSETRDRMERADGDLTLRSDEDLLRLCANGAEAALQELVRRHQGPLYRFLLRLLGSVEDAEEATLDVFTRMWQHAPRFQFRARVATWLYRIAVNIARDIHSRRRARPQETRPDSFELAQAAIGSAEDDALQRLQRADQSRTLLKAMEKLSDSDRLLLVLYYLEERDYDEIQAITELSYTVLKTRLARARRRLRDHFDATAS